MFIEWFVRIGAIGCFILMIVLFIKFFKKK